MTQVRRALIFLLGLGLVHWSIVALAQETRSNAPGMFDYYVLSLLWSPTLCQGNDYTQKQPLCSRGASSFTVEGLWPQYEDGFPEFCQKSARELKQSVLNGIRDVIGDARLAAFEWQRHGTCTGLSANNFFAELRKASALVRIPDEFHAPKAPLILTRNEIINSFVRQNEGMTPNAVMLACDTKRLRAVRFCLTKDLQFQACVGRRHETCSNEIVEMPAANG